MTNTTILSLNSWKLPCQKDEKKNIEKMQLMKIIVWKICSLHKSCILIGLVVVHTEYWCALLDFSLTYFREAMNQTFLGSPFTNGAMGMHQELTSTLWKSQPEIEASTHTIRAQQ